MNCLSHCPECPRKKDGTYAAEPVPGDGPSDAKILFVTEHPGPAENRGRKPMIGTTGDEFNGQYIPLIGCGVSRRTVYVDNVVSCFPGKGRTPSDKVVKSCFEHHIPQLIAQMEPRVIVAMGGIAARCFFSDLDIEMHHGFPVEMDLGYGRVRFMPTYHPSAGLHDTGTITELREDFDNLGQLLRGTLVLPRDEYPEPDYRHCQGMGSVYGDLGLDIYMVTPSERHIVAIDTEYDSKTGEPFCVTYCTQPGTGRLILADDPEPLVEFAEAVPGFEKIIFHNMMADIPMLAKMGINVPIHKCDDTMVRSYHLARYPQALKRLAFRLCGMVMEEFEDVVGPYARADAEAYLEAATYEKWPKPEPQAIEDENGWRVYSPQSLNAKLKRLFTDLKKNPGLDVRKRWEKWSDQERWMVEDLLGPMPPMSIASVPFDKALNYAARDADATLRVYHKLMGLKRQVRRAG